jgi:hypothetical protein
VLAFRLPVTGWEVLLRHPTGAEDILLAEAGTVGIRLAVTLLGALAQDAEGGSIDWSSSLMTDLDAALLRLRQLVVGDVIRSTARCPAETCNARIDVSFRVGEYLEHQHPEPRSDVVSADEPGWLQFDERADGALEGARFRLPTCADLVVIATHPAGEAELLRRCVRLTVFDEEALRRIEEAMESLAPSLYADLEGSCPECGTEVTIPFDPQRYVLRELRARALSIYDDVDTLASRYHWSEREILAMPQVRRMRYTELVHDRGREG